ncbi:MAG: hypothetical protein GC131_02950 [Alphaproteobacteria bacterium]|nr:hypothetical protein [Alphaproteobacteria bacterium]
MAHILLIESDAALAACLKTALEAAEHRVSYARSTGDADKTAGAALALIGFGGREKNALQFSGPVIALGAPQDGAVETLAPPVRLGHLIDRIDYCLRAHGAAPRPALPVGAYQLDVHAKKLRRAGGTALELTEKEAAILAALAAQHPAVVPRDKLLAAVWGYNEKIDTHTLETHIYRLRRKLEDAGERADLLLSDNGGYRING